MIHPLIQSSPEVRDALTQGRPVVALESTIISHGMPFPRNVETALSVEQQVRDNGAVPATIAVMAGRPTVGLTADQIEHLGKEGLRVTKVSRRDLPQIMATGKDGATTVASTMILAARAGIQVFATGGIGGVSVFALTSIARQVRLSMTFRSPRSDASVYIFALARSPTR